MLVLALSDSEHLSPACGAYPLSCRLTILHGYGLGILHFPFSAALNAIRLHLVCCQSGGISKLPEAPVVVSSTIDRLYLHLLSAL